MLSSTGVQYVFSCIRDNSFCKELDNFSDEDLQPYLPLLVYHSVRGRTFASNDVSDVDKISSRLMKFRSANDVMILARIDYASLLLKIQEPDSERNFSLLSAPDKVGYIANHLVNRVNSESVTAELFEPFDVSRFHDETVSILSMLCYFIPSHFNVITISNELLKHRGGCDILYGLVLNHPLSLDQVLQKLLLMRNDADKPPVLKNRNESILKLLNLDSYKAEEFLNTVLEMDDQIRLAVSLLCSDSIGESAFVTTLLGHLMDESSSVRKFLNRKLDKELSAIIRNRIAEVLKNSQKSGADREKIALMLCVLLNLNFLPSASASEPKHEWLQFLNDQNLCSPHTMKLFLAVILACPSLLPANQMAFRDDMVEQQLAAFFSWCREKSLDGDPTEYAQLNQFLLLVTIHMMTGNGVELAKLLSDELCFPIGDTLRKHVTVKRLFLSHACQDTDIAQKAAALGITVNLDDKMSGYLPVHCVNYLLIARTFSRNEITIQDWIENQLNECQLPIHGVMVQMLENFAISCFPVQEDQNFNTQIKEDFFWGVFSTSLFTTDRDLAKKTLSLFYLLAFTRKLDLLPLHSLSALRKKNAIPYSDKLWAEIPIRYILSVMDARPRDFEHIRPSLLHYVGIVMPHMLPVLNASLDMTEDELCVLAENYVPIPVELFNKALDNLEIDLHTISSLVDYLHTAPIQEQYHHHSAVIRSMLISLEQRICPLAVTVKLVRIWCRLENLIPRKLYEQTLQLWLNTESAATSGNIDVTNDLLLKETPTLMFRVDKRIFDSPPHFDCLLRMLSFYLDATKNYNSIRLSKAAALQEMKRDMDEKSQLVKSFTGAQHLAVVQLLLDVCAGNIHEKPFLDEIRELACAQIHQMFVADSALPRLVHFNMYPVELIPIVVEKVPSAHVLLGTINELVATAHLKRRIFAVILVAELAKKYTIPLAVSAVEFIENILGTLLGQVTDEQTVILYLNIMDALDQFVKFGPRHRYIVCDLLSRVKQIAFSRIATYRSEAAASISPEMCLVKRIGKLFAENELNAPNR